jgi:predicted ferric reductase
MKRIKLALPLVVAVLALAWLASDPTPWSTLTGFRPWRAELMQLSGVLGIGVMSVAMILALRPVVFEPWLGGLDKMYRLHKWLGITGLTIAVAHWLLSELPKWAVGLGLLARSGRPPRPPLPDEALPRFLVEQRGLAETLGEWGFYAVALLIVLALVKRFPYRHFFKTHRLLALAYLVLVLHSAALLDFESWGGPVGPLLALLMGAGSVAAVLVLTRRVAAGRKVVGRVAQVVRHPKLDVVELAIQLEGRWPGHAAGQFAFVTLHDDEGPHPFTISSAWAGDGRIGFIVKALGDYTRTLAERTQAGDVVTVEGPYGRFDFAGRSRHQIWIGGGIGITPFIARMKALAQQRDGRRIDLIHTTATLDPGAIALLERDAAAAGVHLRVLWDERDGRLDAERLARELPDWRDADIWFCGPAGFGQALRRGLAALGMAPARFHQELFQLR